MMLGKWANGQMGKKWAMEGMMEWFQIVIHVPEPFARKLIESERARAHGLQKKKSSEWGQKAPFARQVIKQPTKLSYPRHLHRIV